MIDEQSSASGHDYASDRSAIRAGPIHECTVKLGYIKLGFYEYMVYIEVLSWPERYPIYFHVK